MPFNILIGPAKHFSECDILASINRQFQINQHRERSVYHKWLCTGKLAFTLLMSQHAVKAVNYKDFLSRRIDATQRLRCMARKAFDKEHLQKKHTADDSI